LDIGDPRARRAGKSDKGEIARIETQPDRGQRAEGWRIRFRRHGGPGRANRSVSAESSGPSPLSKGRGGSATGEGRLAPAGHRERERACEIACCDGSGPDCRRWHQPTGCTVMEKETGRDTNAAGHAQGGNPQGDRWAQVRGRLRITVDTGAMARWPWPDSTNGTRRTAARRRASILQSWLGPIQQTGRYCTPSTSGLTLAGSPGVT